MNTELLCLNNTYNYTCNAKIIDVGTLEESNFLVMDQTVFYPQGGGQPSDIGTIATKDGRIFTVRKCQIIDNVCYHFGSWENEIAKIDDEVSVQINEQKRKLHARLHTAGHVIDLALSDLGYVLNPTKGYHFENGPYVEYEENLPQDPELKEKLEQTLEKIVAKDAKTSFKIVEGQHNNGKPMRIMSIEGYPDCGCGGTHVEHLDQIGKINIRKVKGNRVAYEVV